MTGKLPIEKLYLYELESNYIVLICPFLLGFYLLLPTAIATLLKRLPLTLHSGNTSALFWRVTIFRIQIHPHIYPIPLHALYPCIQTTLTHTSYI